MQHALTVPSRIRSAAAVSMRHARDETELAPGENAIRALVDFRLHVPITIFADHTIGDALLDMQRLGIHAFLVTPDADGAADQQIAGLITAHDIRVALADGAHRATFVADLMTACDELPLVHAESLTSISAADLHAMFQGTGLSHLVVIEDRPDDEPVVRGIVSRARLARRLHKTAETH